MPQFAPGAMAYPPGQQPPQPPGFPPGVPGYTQQDASGQGGYGVPQVPEKVGRGLLFALGGVAVGVIATVLVWQMGFVASITSFLLAWLSGVLYTRGAGAPPRKGAVPFLVLIVVGVLFAFFAAVFSDFYRWASEYDLNPFSLMMVGLSMPEFWKDNGFTLVIFLVFGALGVFGVFRQLLRKG